MIRAILIRSSILFLFITTLGSCGREADEAPQKISNDKLQLQKNDFPHESYEEKYDKVIETIAYGLTNLSDRPSFRSLLNVEIAKQFDGDDNVLMKTLSDVCTNSGINLKNEMINSLTKNGKTDLIQYADEAINGFKYFDTKLYPQIYIPFTENKNLDQLPGIALNFNDEAILPIVKFNQKGSILTETADENKAKKELIWVISTNESVNDLGILPTKDLSPIIFTFPPNLKLWKAKFKRINVQAKKEGWGNGRADISFISYHVKPNCSPPTLFQARPLMKIANSGLNQWFDPSATNCFSCTLSEKLYDIGSVQGMWEEHEALPILIFEEDNRAKFGRSDQLWPSCTNTTAHYISKEEKYGIIYLNQNNNDWDPTNLGVSIFSLAGISLEFEGGRIQ